MIKILLVTFLLLYSGFSEADIFKCVDNNGAVTYSDQHCKNSAEDVIVLKKVFRKTRESREIQRYRQCACV
ncbi:MAG: DUF4124 domain-containing protein [Methylococcaceae bacterium]